MPDLVPNKFALRCDGVDWEGWLSFSVKQSLDGAYHSFTMNTTDRNQAKIGQWNVRGGSIVEILINNLPIFSGYVQKYSVNISDSDHSISIEGASKTVDASECSHLGPYFWKNTSAESVVSEVLKPFGFTATYDKPLKAIGKEGYKVEVEKSPFEIIKELAERDGLTVITELNGNFRFYDGTKAKEVGFIGRGQYIDLSVDHDLSQAFSEIVVKGQDNDRSKPDRATFKAKQQSETKVDNPLRVGARSNPETIRYRPAVYVQNGDKDAGKAFAEFVKSRFTGDVITANATVKTHLTPSGDIWQAGQLVWLEEPLVSVAQWLVVSDVEFKLDDGSGYQTVLGLKIPNSYDPLGKGDSSQVRKASGEFGNAERAVAT